MNGGERGCPKDETRHEQSVPLTRLEAYTPTKRSIVSMRISAFFLRLTLQSTFRCATGFSDLFISFYWGGGGRKHK